MNTELLKKKILQLAIQGKLVEQEESDGTAEKLIDQILDEKKRLMAEGKIKKEKLSRIYKKTTDNHYYEKFDDGKENDITDEIIFKVPKNWQYVRLKNIINYQHGFSFKSSDYVSSSNILNLRMSNIRPNGQFDADYKKVYLPDSFIEKYKEYEIKDGDIVLALTDMAIENPKILGLPVIVNTNGHRFLLNQRVLKIQPLDSHITEYLQSVIHFLCIKIFLKKQKGGGSVQINLKTSDITDLIIPIPPLKEQIRICNKLKKVLYQINIISELYADLENKKELLKSKIIDLAIKGELTKQLSAKETSLKLIENIIEEKHKLMKEGKIKKENLSVIYKDVDNQFYEQFDNGKIVNITNELPFDIPIGWSWSRLRNIGIYKKGPFGSSLTKDMFVPKSSDTIKVYEQKNAINKDYRLGNYYITNQYFEQEMRGFEVEPGDIIVSCAGTIGETYILPSNIEKGIINQALMKMKIFNPINTDFFLMYFEQILKKESIKNGKGTAMKNIPPFAIFKEYLIPIPPLEEQERIIKTKNDIFKKEFLIKKEGEN